MKKLIAAILMLGMMTCIGACSATSSQSSSCPEGLLSFPIAYSTKEMDVIVSEVTPLSNPTVGEAEWLAPEDFVFSEICDAVVRAKVLDRKEICIEYTKEITRKTYASVLTLSLEEIYSSVPGDTLSIGQVVSASYENSSRSLFEDSIMPEIGEEYYLFLQQAEQCTSPLKYENFCDYIVQLPKTDGFIRQPGFPMTEELSAFLTLNFEDEEIRKHLYPGADLDTALRFIGRGTPK